MIFHSSSVTAFLPMKRSLALDHKVRFCKALLVAQPACLAPFSALCLALCVPQRSLEHYQPGCSKSYENGATS